MTDKKAKVFVVTNNARYDVSTAKDYGEITYLMVDRSTVSPFLTDKFVKHIADQLKFHDYDPTRDYIALTGSTIATALLMWIVGMSHAVIKVLLFDAGTSTYVERTVRR